MALLNNKQEHRLKGIRIGVAIKYGIIACFSCLYKPGAINFQT